MPQLDVYFGEEDLKRLIAMFFEMGSTVVPDLTSERPEYVEITNIESFNESRGSHSAALYFVLNKNWNVAPLTFGDFEKDGKRMFFIRQRSGGPTLDIFAPYETKIDGVLTQPHGFVGIHKLFWNPSTHRNERVPENLLKTYKKVIASLKNESTKVERNQRSYFVTKHAKARMGEGVHLGPPLNEDLNLNSKRSP
jgi:hypothetical protein